MSPRKAMIRCPIKNCTEKRDDYAELYLHLVDDHAPRELAADIVRIVYGKVII